MRRLHELYAGPRKGWEADALEQWFVIPGYRDYSSCCVGVDEPGSDFAPPDSIKLDRRIRANILAMGDVGGTLALAMKLMGGDIVSRIGICDISETALARWEMELNQIALPRDPAVLPPVVKVDSSDPAELFDCDVFIFCASRGVPDVSQKDIDVRMAQLKKNLELVGSYACQAVDAGYDGEFFVVSDPVDPLCKGALLAGIAPERIQGFGLGVMNGRAAYFARQAEKQRGCAEPAENQKSARKSEAAASSCSADSMRLQTAMTEYLNEGRVYGPHGEDLVVANSITNYDEEASLELTRLTVEANLRIRDLGYKPYIAPAVTSGALSILENLRGNWNYSSAWFGGKATRTTETAISSAADYGPEMTSATRSVSVPGAFLGMRNRRCEDGLLIEDPPLDDRLFARIERAYEKLQML